MVRGSEFQAISKVDWNHGFRVQHTVLQLFIHSTIVSGILARVGDLLLWVQATKPQHAPTIGIFSYLVHDTVCYTGQIDTRCTCILHCDISWSWGCIGGLHARPIWVCIQPFWSNHLLQWWLQHQEAVQWQLSRSNSCLPPPTVICLCSEGLVVSSTVDGS